MDTDFEIDILEEEAAEENPTQLPVNFIKVGEIENDDVKVYIKQNVYSALEKYSRVDTQHERGTILIGSYSLEQEKMHIVISDYIEARYTDASASTLTFTHETWDYVHKEHQSKFPDKKIIGWQHTHPNYGIFLSNYDVFIHENFFNLPFQIAYVIDPIQNIRGFFQWKNGRIEKLKGFFIFDDIGKKIDIEADNKNKNKVSAPKGNNRFIQVALCLLAVTVLVLTGAMIAQNQKFLKRFSAQEEEIRKLNETSASAQEETDTTPEQEAAETNSETQPEISTVSFIRYTVEEGDTLYSICKKNEIDYRNNYSLIVSMNGLKNPNSIYAGQNLMLPMN